MKFLLYTSALSLALGFSAVPQMANAEIALDLDDSFQQIEVFRGGKGRDADRDDRDDKGKGRGRGRGRGGDRDRDDDDRRGGSSSRSSDDDRSGSGRSRARIPGGSGCDDPGDVAEHPECRVGATPASTSATGGTTLMDVLFGGGSNRSRARIPGGSGCDDPGDIAEHPECRN